MTRLILLRHGDRDHGFGDVSLSSKGHEQAQQLCEKKELQSIDFIFSSPKKRAQQTVQPLSEKLDLQIQIHQELDQRRSSETEKEFEHRVTSTLEHWQKQYHEKTVLIASHSDWLQVAILNLKTNGLNTAMYCFFGCADYLVLTENNKSTWDIYDPLET